MTENVNIPSELQEADVYVPEHKNILDRAVIKLGNIIATFYIIAVFITVYEVFMRYALGAPTQWVLEISILLIGSAMLYGGCYCMANDGHIRVTIIRDILPKSIQKFNDLIVAFLTFIFTLSLCYAGYFMTEKAFFKPSGDFRLERSGSAFNSPMPALIKAFLLFCVILMAVQTFIQLISAINKLIKKEK